MRDKILIVDDSMFNRQLLRDILHDEYAIIEMKMTVRKLIKKVRKTDALAADVCELFIRYEGNKEPIEKELGITRSVLDKKLKKIARENAEFNIFV